MHWRRYGNCDVCGGDVKAAGSKLSLDTIGGSQKTYRV